MLKKRGKKNDYILIKINKFNKFSQVKTEQEKNTAWEKKSWLLATPLKWGEGTRGVHPPRGGGGVAVESNLPMDYGSS